MPDVQVKIGEDDEILVKGKTITQGYYNLPEVNAESFVDGWFRTGDSGRIDEDGHLIIVDRIKDLFKTSNGKYIAPQQIETRLNMDRYIAQIVVIGDSRNFVTAIIVPELDALKEFAIEQNIAYENLDELLAHEKVQKLYTEHIEKAQEDMASFEKVKKFRLIKKGFSVESGEMTLTLKLRRAVIMHNYKELIDEMYESSPSTQMI
jgi:long-chain acyl-CoA synthetase